MPIALGSGVLYEASTTGSGTGNYDSFLRLAANGDEEGFNTDDGGEADNKDGIWTHSLLVSGLAVVNIGGTNYFEIRLDLNEIQSGDSPNIRLEDLRMFRSTAPADGDDFDVDFAGFGTEVFDLGDPLDLVDTNHGSGTDDYTFYIPTSLFPVSTEYLTLYASFSGSDDGFEEFRVKSQEFVPQPDIGILKVTNGVDDECRVVIAGSTVTWTYTVENNGNVPLTDVVVIDDAGTPGTTADDITATFSSGDTNGNSILDVTETWTFTASGTAIVGEYVNIATVSGVYDDGTLAGQTVTAFEEDCYDGVTPTLSIVKKTNGLDDVCPEILVGEAVTWTYEVTNTTGAAIGIDSIVITDDAGTPDPGDEGDDFNPTAVLQLGETHNVGDLNDNDILDDGETWQYTATLIGGAVAGEYENTATVNGTAHDSAGNTAPVTASEDDCYFGADPEISIVKMTNGTNDLCPVLSVGSTVTWTYNVTNSGNVALTNIDITDDNGTPGENPPESDDDFSPTAVLSGGFNIGDTANFGVFDPGETWVYQATGLAEEGHYENTATVTADYTDDFDNSTTVTASEEDCYTGVEGPGVRTPGFWSNWTDFWDGDLGVPKQATEDCFADYDLLRIDSNGDGTIDGNDTGFSMHNGQLGLFVGDYDRDGVAEAGEDVIFIDLDDALSLINASNKQMNDGVVKIGRDVVASWLNYLAGNPVGTVTADAFYSPREAIDDAVDYLQIFGDSSPSNTHIAGENFDTYASTHLIVRTNSPFWNNDFPGGTASGAEIHGALDEYNNFGSVNGIGYAHECDEQQFLSQMTAFFINDQLLVC